MNDSDQARRARAYLLRVAEPPALALAGLVAEEGPVRAAHLVRTEQGPSAVTRETSARRHLDQVDDDFARARAVGARLVIPEDEEWPDWPFLALEMAASRRMACGVAPLALWVRGGELGALTEQAVAVVGSRAASGYGEHVATEFGHGLAGRGVTVVSGAAYGVDGAAHRGAVAADGPTVAVLACGVDVAYPAGHAALLDRITKQGAVVSEYPPGLGPARYRFLVRNRLIAALGGGTVVVEAGRRSGAKNTAAITRALGRVLMVVPGPVTSVCSVGCHELLRSAEAVPVSSVDEIIETVGRIGADLVRPDTGPSTRTDELGPEAMRVYEALDRQQGSSPDAVAVESGVPLPRVRALLPELELIGLVERREAGWGPVMARKGRGNA